MATIPTRSNGFRNFALPRWGIQRHMKCIEVDSTNDGTNGDSVDHQHQSGSPVLESVVVPLQLTENNQPSSQLRKSPPKSVEKGGPKEIKEFKENIVRFKITEPLVSKHAVENEVENKEKVKPLILRKRKVSFKMIRPSNEDDQCQELRTEEKSETKKRWRGVTAETERKNPVKFSLKMSRKEIEEDFQRRKPLLPISLNNEDQRKELRTAEKTVNKKRGRGVMAEAKKIASLKVSLSREEIEEDFIQILGHKPHCRPKKRPRNVQKALANTFPGLHLDEVSVTADLYKVRDR